MIIPSIDLNKQSIDTQLQSTIKHWGLFGRVAIRNLKSDLYSQFIKIVQSCMGRIDLQVELLEPDTDSALELLNAGVCEIMVPTSQIPSFAGRIPGERLIAIEIGETSSTTETKLLSGGVESAIKHASLVPENWVQCELDQPDDETINKLDRTWIDCLVDTVLLHANPEFISESISQRLTSDRPDGLWPTMIVDQMGVGLGLAYSNAASLSLAIQNRTGVYWSRSRNAIWEKGKTSGATQTLERVDLDCDRDCLRFTVQQSEPGFCHRDNYACFGNIRTIQTVTARLAQRLAASDKSSFTHTLATNPSMLRKKLVEEANELADTNDPAEVAWEAADLLYFSLVRMIDSGVELHDIFAELSRRLNRVVRRPNKLAPNDTETSDGN